MFYKKTVDVITIFCIIQSVLKDFSFVFIYYIYKIWDILMWKSLSFFHMIIQNKIFWCIFLIFNVIEKQFWIKHSIILCMWLIYYGLDHLLFFVDGKKSKAWIQKRSQKWLKQIFFTLWFKNFDIFSTMFQ